MKWKYCEVERRQGTGDGGGIQDDARMRLSEKR